MGSYMIPLILTHIEYLKHLRKLAAVASLFRFMLDLLSAIMTTRSYILLFSLSAAFPLQ